MILATLCYNTHLELNNSINFSFKTPLKRNAPMPFSRHGAFFIQFLLLPLTLLFIGGWRYLPLPCFWEFANFFCLELLCNSSTKDSNVSFSKPRVRINFPARSGEEICHSK